MDSLKTLIYFSIFKYPLKKEEIYTFSSLENTGFLESELSELIAKKTIYKIKDYYLCDPDIAQVKKRESDNKMAKNIFPKAIQNATLIAKFPYVEGVGISGSLSKGVHNDESDIDYFIITKPNRLWIARTFLILYKKIFLLNSRKYFCVNYFITSENLEIVEKNRFTATELVTLMPICGNEIFDEFYKKNSWVKNYFPHYIKKERNVLTIKKTWISKCIEVLLNTSIGSVLDAFFMKTTYAKWKRKFSDIDKKNFDIALKSTKNVSKHHPQNFQKKVIDTLNEKYKAVIQEHEIIIETEHA